MLRYIYSYIGLVGLVLWHINLCRLFNGLTEAHYIINYTKCSHLLNLDQKYGALSYYISVEAESMNFTL